MTHESLKSIRSRWLFPESAGGLFPPEKARAAMADIQRLLDEVERLQASCDQITRQYARLCQRCGNGGQHVCRMAG